MTTKHIGEGSYKIDQKSKRMKYELKLQGYSIWANYKTTIYVQQRKEEIFHKASI